MLPFFISYWLLYTHHLSEIDPALKIGCWWRWWWQLLHARSLSQWRRGSREQIQEFCKRRAEPREMEPPAGTGGKAPVGICMRRLPEVEANVKLVYNFWGSPAKKYHDLNGEWQSCYSFFSDHTQNTKKKLKMQRFKFEQSKPPSW